MTILAGSKADLLKSQVFEHRGLDSQFNITAGLGVTEVVPALEMILTLPGTYLMLSAVRAQVEISAGVRGFVNFDLRTTLLSGGSPGLLINGSCGIAANVDQVDIFNDSIATTVAILVVTAPVKVETFVLRNGGGAVFTQSRILGDGNADTTITAIQLL